MKELFIIAVGSALVNNVVLSQFLGICPFLGVSKKIETAAGMGGAVIFVITIASFCTSVVYEFILQPLNIEYLQTIVFILVIAALVQFVEMFLKKSMPSLYQALGVYLPLIDVYKRQILFFIIDRNAVQAYTYKQYLTSFRMSFFHSSRFREVFQINILQNRFVFGKAVRVKGKWSLKENFIFESIELPRRFRYNKRRNKCRKTK